MTEEMLDALYESIASKIYIFSWLLYRGFHENGCTIYLSHSTQVAEGTVFRKVFIKIKLKKDNIIWSMPTFSYKKCSFFCIQAEVNIIEV